MGFDWQAHVAYLQAHPAWARGLALAYHSSAAQIALVVITLSAVRRTARLWRFVQLFVLTLLTVIVVSTLFPAKGPYAFYAGVESATSALETVGATWHLEALSSLRSGAATSLALADIRGLATFPSFHVCLALITAWALAPIPIVGPLAVFLNGMVVVATLAAGGHYLPDVLAGGAIGGFVLVSPWAVTAWRGLRSSLPTARRRSAEPRPFGIGARLRDRPDGLPQEGEART